MRCQITSQRNSRIAVRQKWSSARTQRTGVAAIEFAIVLPVLVTILLGATDFGRISYSTIAIANAARCGAEYASMNPVDSTSQAAWTAGVKRAVADELSESAAFDTSKLAISIATVDESGGQRRTSVQVTYPFTTIIAWPAVPSSLTLQKTAVMRGIR